MFCASLRSLCDGLTGIGGVIVTTVADDDDDDDDDDEGAGKGGGGPVGEVGTGEVANALPTAGICRALAKMSPLLGIACGTTGTEPMDG